MNAHDAVFIAIAATVVGGRSPRWQAAGLAPLLSFAVLAIGGGVAGALGPLLVALLACLAAPRLAPVALLLAWPAHADLAAAVVSSATWLGGVYLVDSLRPRLDRPSLPTRLRGAPIHLVTVGILYYILQPLFHR